MRENYRNSIASIKKFPQFTTMHVIDGQAGLIICASLIFYSLTIDNILNIIVLLILAGISISMLSGENSILNQAVKAREQTKIAQEKENIELAYISAAMKKLGDDVTGEDLQNELNSSVGLSKTKVTQKSTNRLNVKFKDSKNTYSVTDGKVEKIEQEDGIYVGNVRLAGINPFSFSYKTYDAYRSSTSQEEENISYFFQKCHSKLATKSDYENAIDDAETAGISTEWIDYAYNNQGVRIRNIQPSSYDIYLTSPDSWDTDIPLTGDITSVDKNFVFDLNIDIQYAVGLEQDAETGDWRAAYGYFQMNPEAISFYYKDENQEIPDEVQLPFGMVLKQVKNSNDLVIEWQGQTFNCDELRAYILNNTKIVYNGQTVNLTSSTSGDELDDLFGIKAEDLYDKGYIDELVAR